MLHPDAEPVEIAEITAFLARTPPFDVLPRDLCREAARSIDITYEPEGTTVLELDEISATLFIVRTGAVELHDPSGSLIARLGEREFFGYPSLLTDAPAQRRVTTIEDTLVYHLPETVFDRCRAARESFDHFFARAHADRIQDALKEQQQNVPLMASLRSLGSRSPVTVPPTASIREAARTMCDERVSSLLIQDEGSLIGLITDRDLRNRVLAEGLDPEETVSTVMTTDPWTISADALAFEALLTMSRHNVHHLPIVEGDTLRGVVTTTDLMRQQVDSPVYLVGEIWKQDQVDGLADIAAGVPGMVRQMVEAGAQAGDVGRMVTSVTDAVTERLLDLATDRLGEPPVPFAWLALGSQARQEQTAHSDQDNALLLSDTATDAHDPYFADLASFVCDGLDACGYQYCPGDVMATTDRWRQPLQEWKRTFRGWIDEPHPQSLMHASIFFDLRHVYGNPSLTKRLQSYVLGRTSQNSIFLASLTVNALNHKPPLGFFRQFVLEEHGGQKDTLDLKLNGVVPIIDLARIYALAHGVSAVHTLERFQRLVATGGMNSSDAADLRDAFEFIGTVRIQHQADQIRRGTEPDNFVSPDQLSDFDRRHLKDAFRITRRMQSALSQRYQTHFIS